MSKIQFDVNVANGVGMDVTTCNDVLPVWWMKVKATHWRFPLTVLLIS